MEVTKLPDGWHLAKLGEIVKIGSRNVDPSAEPERFWNYVALENVEQATGRLVGFAPTRGKEIGSTKARFQEGDVLYGKLRPYLRKAWVAEFDGCSSTDLIPLTPGDGILAEYLKWFLLSPLHMEYIMPLMAGIRMPRLRSDDLFNMPIPLPPIDEQRRIVTRVEEMMDRSRRSRGALAAAADNTKSLLNVLIAQVFAMNLGFDKDLAPSISGYLSGTKTRASDLSGLPSLPSGWHWRTVESLGETGEQPVLTGPFGTNLKGSDFVSTGVPVLTIGCLSEAGIRLDKAQYVNPEKAEELERYQLRTGDLLFSRMASVGRAGFVTDEFAGMLFNYHLMRLRLDATQLMPELFVFYVKASGVVREYLRAVNHGATRDGINTEQLLRMPVMVPPPEAQGALLADIRERVRTVHAMRDAQAQAEASLGRLDQAILAEAFSGGS